MPETLYLIEELPVNESLLQQWAETKGTLLVTLNARTGYELSRRGIRHKRADEFYLPNEYERVGEDNFPKVLEFVRLIDGRLASLERIKRCQLKLAEANYFRLKVLFDSVFLAAFEIGKIIESTRPERIYFYGWSIRQKPDEIIFTNEETLYGKIIPIMGSAYAIPVLFAAPSDVRPGHTLNEGTPKQQWLRRLRARLSSLLLAKNLLWPVARHHFVHSFLCQTRPATFFVNPAYDVNYAIWALIRKRIAPIYHIDVPDRSIARLFPFFAYKKLAHAGIPADRQALEETGQQLIESGELLRFFDFNGINLWEAVKERISLLVRRIFPDNLETYELFHRYFSDFSGSRLVMPNAADGQKEMVLRAARDRGLLVYKHQHGSDGFFYFPILEYYSLINTDALFVFGQGVDQAIRRRFKRSVKLLPVGSAALEDLQMKPLNRMRRRNQNLLLRHGVDLNRPVVIYPLSVMAFNRIYISYHIYPDWEYFKVHQGIADVFLAHPEAQLVIKSHPSLLFPENPIVQYLQDHKIANSFIVREGSFTDLLYHADLFIIDAPSTVVLQAMTTSKKILIYNGIMRFEPEARKAIQKRCSYHETFNPFLIELDQTLKDRNFDPPATDSEFLRLYGTDLGDGHAAERVAAELMNPTVSRSAPESQEREDYCFPGHMPRANVL